MHDPGLQFSGLRMSPAFALGLPSSDRKNETSTATAFTLHAYINAVAADVPTRDALMGLGIFSHHPLVQLLSRTWNLQ